MRTSDRGRWGEELAAKFLRKKRYKLVEMNYRCRMGEIDLIVENRKYLVFVEVKLRKNANFAEALEFVDSRKQERLKTTAMLYLTQHETEKLCRFDVIEIYAPDGEKKPQIRHLEDAFE
ncbi:MAG: YraN family protein [Ruminococcaceae bacterium]|nr:YraN family protein [Oscillospiraceae bacterium]